MSNTLTPTVDEILAKIRAKQQEESKLATASSPEEAETNIKYCNSRYERRNKKELKQVSAECPGGTSTSETNSSPTPSAPLGSSQLTSSSSLSPVGDIASLVSLQDGTTSCVADATQEVVKTKMITGSAGPEIHYAKITTRKPVKNTRRRKINFDFNVSGSNKMNKITFATTDKFWEWERDLKADYQSGALSASDWAWYQQVAQDYKTVKAQFPTATIGKGCQRGNSKAMKKTACIYTGTEAQVYIGDWTHTFELDMIHSGPASVHHDSMAEYRTNRTGYEDLSWE